MNGIGFFFVRLWAYCMSICPFWLLYLKSDFYFIMVYHVAHYRRKVVRNNLSRSFPEKSHSEIKAIEKQFYHNLCDQVVEMFKLPRMSVDEVTRRIAVTNPELIADLYAKGKSLFFAIPHSGNWEWFGKRMQTLSPHHPMALYKKVKNPVFERFIYEMRTALPVEMIESDAALRTLAKRTGTTDQVLILADQSPMGHKSDYWTTFMHQDTSWFTGLERMAQFLDYAVVFIDMKRVKRGYYELTFHNITETPKETEKGYIMEQYVRHIERFLHEQPDNWLWSHRRWKRQRNIETP